MTTSNEILQVSNWATNTTRTHIEYSGNLPDPRRHLLHRDLILVLSRLKPTNPLQKKLFKEIASWNLDLSSEKERYPLNDSEFWLESLGCYLSLKEIYRLVSAFPKLGKSYKGLRYLEKVVIRAVKHNIGNCGETSKFAFLLLREYPVDGLPGLPKITEKIPLELVGFEDEFDHSFILINRDPNTTFNDPLTWNDDTIICDPWLNESYTKKQLFAKSPAEVKFILSMFDGFRLNSSGFLGDKYNKEVHTKEWEKNLLKNKSWLPASLITLTKQPKREEKLPAMRPSSQVSKVFSARLGMYKMAGHDFNVELDKAEVSIDRLKILFKTMNERGDKLQNAINKLIQSGEMNTGRAALLGPFVDSTCFTLIRADDWDLFFKKYDMYQLLLKNYKANVERFIQRLATLSDLNTAKTGLYFLSQNFQTISIYFAEMKLHLKNCFKHNNLFASLESPEFDFKALLLHLNQIPDASQLEREVEAELADITKQLSQTRVLNDLYASGHAIKKLKTKLTNWNNWQANFLLNFEINKNYQNYPAFNISHYLERLNTYKNKTLSLVENRINLIKQLGLVLQWIFIAADWKKQKTQLFQNDQMDFFFFKEKEIFNVFLFNQFIAFNEAYQDDPYVHEILSGILRNENKTLADYQKNLPDFIYLAKLQLFPAGFKSITPLSVNDDIHRKMTDILKNYIQARIDVLNQSSVSGFFNYYLLDVNMTMTKLALARECLFILERTRDLDESRQVIERFIKEDAAHKNSHTNVLGLISFSSTLQAMEEVLDNFELECNSTCNNNKSFGSPSS